MNLDLHINILKNLRFPMKAQIIRLTYLILEEHQKDIEAKGGINWLLDQVMPARPVNFAVTKKEPRPVEVIYDGQRIPQADPNRIRRRGER